MTRSILFAMALAASAMTASAANVTYTTAITWDCGSASNCSVSGTDLTINDLILRYTPNSATVDAPVTPGFTGANFGEVIALCSVGGDCSGLTSVAGALITVTINQTVPFVQSTQFNGVLGGQISNTQSLSPALMTFSPLFTSTSDGFSQIVNYFLQQPSFPANGYIINSINDNRSTSLQGAVNFEDVPEPSTIALIGLGLAAIAIRRRKA